MAKTQYLTYYINISDEARYNAILAEFPSGGVIRAPRNEGPPVQGAAVEFSPDGTPLPILEVGDPWVSDSLSSEWFTTSNDFPRNVATFQQSSGWWIFGSNTRFYWFGKFVLSPTLEEEEENPPGESPEISGTFPQRLWIEGFEVGAGAGTNFANSMAFTRAASRTTEGMGGVATGGSARVATVAIGSSGDPIYGVMQTFYFRCTKLPTASTQFWRTTQAATANDGLSVELLPSGQLAFYTWPSGTKTLQGTAGSIALNTWAKFDIFTFFRQAVTAGNGAMTVYLNGAVVATHCYTLGGLQANMRHSQSILGVETSTDGVLQFDDWIGSKVPESMDPLAPAFDDEGTYALGDTVQLEEPDPCGDIEGLTIYRCAQAYTATALVPNTPGTAAGFAFWSKLTKANVLTVGHHVERLTPSAFAGAHAGWTGDVRILLQRPADGSGGLLLLNSTTALAPARVTTDAQLNAGTRPGSAGMLALSIGALTKRGTTSGELGYDVGGTVAMTALTENTSPSWHTIMYAPAGLTEPATVPSIELRYTKGNDANSGDLYILGGQVELVGQFGEGDEGAIPFKGHHNHAYPRTPWARDSVPPLSPVIVKSGTYVGNGTGQDLLFPAPVHWLWIRPLSGSTDGVRWYAGMLTAHEGIRQGTDQRITEIDQDPDFADPGDPTADQQMQFRVRVAGTSGNVNANGVTFAYVAFMDPGARFHLTHVMKPGHTASLPQTASLINSGFLPEFGFFHKETLDNTSTAQAFYKGAGLGAAEVHALSGSGAAVASAVTFAAGSLSLNSGFVTGTEFDQMVASLWRREDGNDHADQARVLALGTYTGDGAASRSITTNMGGRRPLYAFVSPSGNATAYHRDPSHTTNTSTPSAGGAAVATAITAGAIDGFTVGSSLNANGVVYDYFVIPGSEAAGNGGWSTDGTFVPVPSDSPIDPDAPEDPPDDPCIDLDTGLLIPGCGDDDDDDDDDDPVDDEPDLDPDTPLPDTELFCIDFTQKLTNLALARIGISRPVADLAAEQTEAAVQARLHIKEAVERTLVAHPWAWATKYATLTLVGGAAAPAAPLNADWRYSYRRPSDCLFERRIVGSRGSAANPAPVPFDLSADADGWLIFTNEANAVLEYTARGLCPTYMGDTLFKDAAAWQLAAKLAPPLTRMEDKEVRALQQFDMAIARADAILRTGKPGPTQPTTATDAIDLTATHIAANLTVANLALVRIGAAQVTSLSDGSREAVTLRGIFEDELRAVLRDHPWAFATRYAELALTAGPATWDEPLVQTWSATRTYEEKEAVVRTDVVYYAVQQTLNDDPATDDGTNWTEDAPEDANPDWLRAYRVPSDNVFVRRLVKAGARRSHDADPWGFKLGTDEAGDLLYTDAEEATLEYTARFAGTVARADALFRNAFAWRLSAALAPTLAQVDPEMIEQGGRAAPDRAQQVKGAGAKAQQMAMRERMALYALGRYYDVLERAKVGTANEQQQPPDGDAPWIAER